MTVDQSDILRVPGQILTIYLGVIDRYVLTLPERVLGHNLGMVYLYVLTVLEHVLRVAFQTVYIDVFGEHKRIGAIVQLDVMQLQVLHLPECLVSIVDGDILQFHPFHLTEELRTVNDTVFHGQVVRVPDSRA